MREIGLIGMMALALAPGRVAGQSAPLPDSVVVSMISPALFRLLEYPIAAAAQGRRHVIKLELPEGRLWSRVAAHVLVATNGRLSTPADSNIRVIGIREIRFLADTLIATIYEETRELCPNGRWLSTGTDYEARTRRSEGGWTRIALTPAASWDALGCVSGDA